MTKRVRSILAFMTAWLFALSLLSNCYCLPTGQVGLPTFASQHSAQPAGMQSKMPAHCEHHSEAAKEKQSDCSPRFNTDQFENVVAKTRPVHDMTVDLQLIQTLEKQVFPQAVSFEVEPFLNSSPPIYILLRSLLI